MKKAILETLKKNRDQFISGEELSGQIGVTRTAIWKHMKQLKEEGYEIESIPRRGYRLINEPDTLDAHGLESEIATEMLGNRILHYEKLDSTNNLAKKMAAEGAEEGTVIIAEEQEGGRGRLGRQWASPKGTGIWMSIILKPPIGPMEAPKITQITAAALIKAIKKVTGCDAGIKWPNDIVVENKKVCGILTEMSAELSSVNYVILGIGINVNINQEDFPEEIRDVAISLKTCIKESVSRKALVIHILRELEELYLDFIKHKNIHKSIELCKKYSVTLGKQVKVIYRDKEILAEAVDLTDEGELIIKKADGQLEKIISGEVSVRGIYDYI